jgi:large subunit ribosomal protein L17
VKTTITRAKEARKVAEKVITLTKQGDVPARRRAFSILRDRDIVKKIFTEYPVRFEGRAGGYTRIIKVESCRGDNAPMGLLELV